MASDRPTDVVPVPAALFGPLLERVTDAATLRCALRAVFVLHRKQASPERRGRLAAVTAAELTADPVVGVGEAEAARALATLVAEGVLLYAPPAEEGSATYCLDTPANRRALAALAGWQGGWRDDGVGPWDPVADAVSPAPRPNIFRLFEENIGVITPMAADKLKDMEAEYPADWIADAFEQAVVSNARSLRYVEAVLRRWRDDGRGDGEPKGRFGTIRASEIVRRSGR